LGLRVAFAMQGRNSAASADKVLVEPLEEVARVRHPLFKDVELRQVVSISMH
jgi:hypothetical protein